MASYPGMTNFVEFAVGLKPSGAFPLDPRTMFGSYQEAAAAAATAAVTGSEEAKSTNYYIGQTISVFENDVVGFYQIQADKTLKAVGATVAGDNKTIVANEGVVSLKNFGTKYYAYKAADNIIASTGGITDTWNYPDNMPDAVEGAYVYALDGNWYVCTNGTWVVSDVTPSSTERHVETEGWKAGLTPQVIQTAEGYELAWYEPSTTTMEGVTKALASVQASVDAIDEKVDNNYNELSQDIADENTRAVAAEQALDAKIKSNTDAIGVLNGDAETEGSVLNHIANTLEPLLSNDTAINNLQALVDWADNHAADYIELQNNVTANTKAIDELEAIVGTLPEGIQATDVIGYIQELVTAEQTRATAAETDLQTQIDNIKTTTDSVGTAATLNKEEIATAEQGALAESAVQDVIASQTNGNILVDGDEVKVYELPKANVTTLGGIKVDGTSITTNDEGVASVAAVDYTKVTNLDTQLEAAKTAAITEAAEAAADTYIPLASIAGSTTIAESPEAASDAKVISEKVLLDALTWKTTM